jgi:dipeptidyl aminopeptidase/acylaminoacyl peptidase
MSDIARLAHDWARIPDFWEMHLSKDGNWAAWTWTGVTEAGNVWVAPTDGSAPPRRVTDEPDHIYVRSFSPDSRRLLLAQSEGSSEHDHLFLLDLASGEQRLLTPRQDDHYVFGGAFTPDGGSILYAASWDDAAKTAIDGQRIYLHDLASGTRRIVGASESLSDHPLELSEDGRLVLYHRHERHPAGSQIWLLDLKTGADREILNAGDARKAEAQWAPDSRQLVVTAEAGDHRRVGLIDIATDAVRWLIDDPALQISGAHWPKGSDRIVVTETRNAREVASLLDPASGARAEFPAGEGTLLPVGPAADGAWVCYHYDARHPMRIVRRHGGALQPLSEFADRRIAELELAAAEEFRWRAGDGLEIQGWLYRPKEAARGAVILVHGGPTAHSEDAFDPEVQYLVAAGFAVLQPNYRGSTGFGLPFQEAIKLEGWGGPEQDDIARGAEALIARGVTAPGRVGVTGTSYGGYSSWCQITRTPPEIIKAAAPICGMTDLVVDYETTRPDLRPYSEEMMGGSPAEVPERYRERSPIHFVDRIRGKLMIVQGLNDPNVTPQNVTDVRARLDAAGIQYELLLFEDEGHGIAKPANRMHLCRQLARFFAAAFAP